MISVHVSILLCCQAILDAHLIRSYVTEMTRQLLGREKMHLVNLLCALKFSSIFIAEIFHSSS